ncbi:MAG: hypothetical protein WDZ75_01780 [Candidatus Paceibacterota bacterium]
MAQKPQTMRQSFAVTTTFSDAGYHSYGQQMIQSFDRYWPRDIVLHVYYEGQKPDICSPRISYHDIKIECPDLITFLERNKDNPRDTSRYASILTPLGELAAYKKWYEQQPENIGRPLQIRHKEDGTATLRVKYAGTKFSFKSYVQYYASKAVDTDCLIWIDADSRFLKPIPCDLLERLCPPSSLVSFLGRHSPNYTETGWLAFNRRHQLFEYFMKRIKEIYDTDALYDLDSYHDCWVFDTVRKLFEQEYGAKTHNLSTAYNINSQHPLLETPLGGYVDHFKGIRGKKYKRSTPKTVARHPNTFRNFLKKARRPINIFRQR